MVHQCTWSFFVVGIHGYSCIVSDSYPLQVFVSGRSYLPSILSRQALRDIVTVCGAVFGGAQCLSS